VRSSLSYFGANSCPLAGCRPHGVVALTAAVQQPPVQLDRLRGGHVLVEGGDLVGVEFGELLAVTGVHARQALEVVAVRPQLDLAVAGGGEPARHVLLVLEVHVAGGDDGFFEATVDQGDDALRTPARDGLLGLPRRL
jgi:hypothetical protein